RTSPDLVFLDSQMPQIDGLTLARTLGRTMPAVVFVTAYDEYALRAFRAHALDYLLKPVQADLFDRALLRARTYLRGRDHEAHLLGLRRELHGGAYRRRVAVRKADRIVIVRTEDIHWIEAQGNYIRIHTGDGAYLTREPLHQFVATLDPARFLRVHRSAVVNVDRVRELRLDNEGRLRLVVGESQIVPAGAAYRLQVEDVFGIAR
ncbi:MAG TPA: LytTR family DNA-binding domain-containing protein, partial [Thermoanaerobaculia bacterium]|nr:LytTR family DNA-binding domain-containing protein [Thermoanaerobaculia bacterium]